MQCTSHEVVVAKDGHAGLYSKLVEMQVIKETMVLQKKVEYSNRYNRVMRACVNAKWSGLQGIEHDKQSPGDMPNHHPSDGEYERLEPEPLCNVKVNSEKVTDLGKEEISDQYNLLKEH